MAIDIDTLYEMLDERKPIEVQEEAIRGEKDKILICIDAACRI